MSGLLHTVKLGKLVTILAYITYLVVGIVGILFNLGTDSSLAVRLVIFIFLIFGVIVLPYLAFIIVISLVKYGEKPLFILGLASLAELLLQVINTSQNDSPIIYYSLAYPYFIGITTVSLYQLYFLGKDIVRGSAS